MTSRLCRAALVGVVALAMPGALAAQGPIQRGVEHERLDVFVGDWRGAITEAFTDGRTDELTSEVSYSWQMGGIWLQEDVVGETPIGTVYNRALITFNPRRGEYTGFWIDTIGGMPILFEVRWLDEHTLEFDTGDFDYYGQTLRFRLHYTIVSDSEYRSRQWTWLDGEQTVEGNGIFTRLP